MCMQNLSKIFLKSYKQFSLFHNLDLGKASIWQSLELDLVNVIEYAISAKNLHTVLEIGPVSHFQNLDLGKASTEHMAFGNPSGWVLSISMCVQNFYQNISHGSRVMGNFHVFTVWTSAKPRPMDSGILQSLGLDLININGHAKFHQTIP